MEETSKERRDNAEWRTDEKYHPPKTIVPLSHIISRLDSAPQAPQEMSTSTLGIPVPVSRKCKTMS